MRGVLLVLEVVGEVEEMRSGGGNNSGISDFDLSNGRIPHYAFVSL